MYFHKMNKPYHKLYDAIVDDFSLLGNTPDETQWAAINEFSMLAAKLMFPLPFFGGAVHSLYVWGNVGSGKTFMLNSFFRHIPINEKKRVHFHEFLSEIHGRLKSLSGRKNPLGILAREYSLKYRILCFDEFHVHDVVDAILIKETMQGLFENGVAVVATSNYRPDQLCPRPEANEKFRPTIELIRKNYKVLKVGNGIDYRRDVKSNCGTSSVRRYYHCQTLAATSVDDAVMAIFEFKRTESRGGELDVNGHRLKALALEGSLAWFDFNELFVSHRAASDYLLLTTRFQSLIITGIPSLDRYSIDVKLRLLSFIDIAYDRNVVLFVSSEAPPEALFAFGEIPADSDRMISRLQHFDLVV